MSDLIARLRRRAHFPEFKICGEAADALEAAERERDAANRRCRAVSNERQRGLLNDRQATRASGSLAIAGS